MYYCLGKDVLILQYCSLRRKFDTNYLLYKLFTAVFNMLGKNSFSGDDVQNEIGRIGFNGYKEFKDVPWMECEYLNEELKTENDKRLYRNHAVS